VRTGLVYAILSSNSLPEALKPSRNTFIYNCLYASISSRVFKKASKIKNVGIATAGAVLLFCGLGIFYAFLLCTVF